MKDAKLNIIVPICGKSSRYPTKVPKWLLRTTNNNLMITNSILGISGKYNKIYIFHLKEHETLFSLKNKIINDLNTTHTNIASHIEFISIERQTRSQAETIKCGLDKINKEFAFLIKDSDNYFEINVDKIRHNGVCYLNLSDYPDINSISKSYICMDDDNKITKIKEKKVISNYFSAGGYFFESVNDFFKNYKESLKNEVYISEIINDMILKNYIFYGYKCKNYIDWGVYSDYLKFKDKKKLQN